MRIITKKALPRRTVLRGLGTTLALPLLEAMVPALTPIAKTAARPVRRFGVFYVPNGMSIQPGAWAPESFATSPAAVRTSSSSKATKGSPIACLNRVTWS